MSVFRVEKTANFTVMSNVHLQDKNLSLKAKGLLSQMLSLPDDWDYTLRGLAAINKEAVNTIGGIVKELIAAGYIVREQSRTDGGCFSEYSYVIYEVPQEVLQEEMTNNTQSLENSGLPPRLKNCDTVKSLENSGLPPRLKNCDTVESLENSASPPRLKNCDTVQSLENSGLPPRLKNCDTVKTLENSGLQPCRKNRDTVFCDTNKILNKQNIDISNHSVHSNNITKMGDWAFAKPKESNGGNPYNYEQYIQIIRENISYDDLITTMPDSVNEIDGIVNIILEIMMSNHKTVRISKEDMPIQLVKTKYMKLRYEHIEYVMECMSNNTTKVKDMRAYMRSVLYNAADTIDMYYTNAVRHDFYGAREGIDSS